MKFDNCRNHAEAEAVSGRMAARLRAIETLENFFAILLCDSGTAVRNA